MKLPGYFRCTDPTKRCPLCLSGEAHQRGAGFQCPVGEPGCDELREPVPLMEALWSFPRVRLTVLAVAGVVLLALVIRLVTSGDGDQQSLEVLEQKLEALSARISGLAVPLGNNASETAANKARLAELEQRIHDFAGQVSAAVSKRDTPAVEMLKQEEARLRSEVDRMSASQSGSVSGRGEAAIKARLIRDEIMALESEAESLREKVLTRRSNLAERAGELIFAIQAALAKLKPYLSPTSSSSPPLDTQPMQDTLEKAVQALTSYEPPPPPVRPPFARHEATLRVAANPTLARSLVEPLIASWTSAEWVKPSKEEAFLISADQLRKIILTPLPDEKASAVLVEDQADVVFTNQVPDGLTRAEAEVVAMDALCVFSHPSANMPPFIPGSSATPLFAASAGGDLAKKAREFGLKISESAQPSGPIEKVFDDSKALALAFYHEEKGVPPRAGRVAVQPKGATSALLPSPFSIATEDYALSFRVVLRLGKGAGHAHALELARFALSDAGQRTIAEQGYVDLRLRPSEVEVPPDIRVVLASALGMDSIQRARRLNTNLRFEFGQAVLDLKAKADIERLPPFLAANHPEDKAVILGFTDNIGGAEVNDQLSRERAAQVADELKRYKVAAVAEGLGPRFPVDDNGTESGRARNRRAEVWIVTP